MLIPLALPFVLAPPLAPQTVDVERADGTRSQVELSTVAPGDFEPGGLVSLRLPGASAPESAADVDADDCQVTLIGGDRLTGRVLGGEGETLELELGGVVRLPVGIEELDHLRFPDRVPAGRGLSHAETGDRLYVLRGVELDRVDGAFEAFGSDGVTFYGDELGSKRYDWAEVAALFVEALGGGDEAAPASAPPVAIDLVDGSRLRGGLTGLSEAGCAIRLSRGRTVELPLALVRELWRDDGTIAFLSDLEPAETRAGSVFGDEFGMRWPHRVDRAVSGGLLRSGGRTYARGLGVHAGSRLRWELDGGWSTLRGRVAIDDSVLGLPGAARASVEFRIWVDGTPDEDEPTWRSGPIGAGEVPLAIEGLDLTGARSLTLEVDPAEHYSVGDRANWLRMLLVRG